jgi:hypothetical protein
LRLEHASSPTAPAQALRNRALAFCSGRSRHCRNRVVRVRGIRRTRAGAALRPRRRQAPSARRQLHVRHHGTIGWDGGHFTLTDASRNGTFVTFDDGVVRRVHRKRQVLDRQGTLRLGHPASVAIEFAIELRSAADRGWVLPAHGDAHVIRCEGHFWTLVDDGRALRVRNRKGLEYLAQLFFCAYRIDPTAPVSWTR